MNSRREIDRKLRYQLVQEIKREIQNIGCIYRSVGDALYDEPVDRLAQRIARIVEERFEQG